ncbi:MAG: hypothetical protein ACRD4V_11160 [Candidatus Acidiferrales bacterium]
MAPNVSAKHHYSVRRNERSVNLGRHAAQCRICNHPDRASIEFDFLNWRSPWDLVNHYHLRSLTTIYRHAHATGLFGRRRLNLRFALERMVERVGEVPVTASAILRSVRAIACMNDSGEWIDPPTRVIISRARSHDEPRPSHERKSRAARKPAPLIFETALLEDSFPPPEPVPPEKDQQDEHAEQHPSLCKNPPSSSQTKTKSKTIPENIEMVLDPAFAAAVEERRRGIEEDRVARELAAAKKRDFLIGNEMHSREESNA